MCQSEADPGAGLSLVLERFPEHEDSIRDLCGRNEQFMELCTDYGECVAALNRYRGQGTGDLDRVEHYTEFRVHLEQELLAGIAACHAPPVRSEKDV